MVLIMFYNFDFNDTQRDLLDKLKIERDRGATSEDLYDFIHEGVDEGESHCAHCNLSRHCQIAGYCCEDNLQILLDDYEEQLRREEWEFIIDCKSETDKSCTIDLNVSSNDIRIDSDFEEFRLSLPKSDLDFFFNKIKKNRTYGRNTYDWFELNKAETPIHVIKIYVYDEDYDDFIIRVPVTYSLSLFLNWLKENKFIRDWEDLSLDDEFSVFKVFDFCDEFETNIPLTKEIIQILDYLKTEEIICDWITIEEENKENMMW